MPVASRAGAVATAAAALLGRSQGPELLYSGTVDFSSPQQLTTIPNLNLRRGLESLLIVLRFRVAVTVANYAAISPEAPQSILQLITLTGTHSQYGNLTPLRMSGATAFAWAQLFNPNGLSDCLINGTKAPALGRPMSSAFLGTTAGSPFDIQLIYAMPLGPQMGVGASVKRQAVSFLYQPSDWGNTLQLVLSFGDKSALGNPTGATVAFTAFGSGSGLPGVEVYGNYSLLGPMFTGRMNNGVIVRQEQGLSGFTALGSALRLMDLQRQITTNVVVKTGTLQTTGITSGVSTLAAVSDVQLEKTQLVVDNKAIRNNARNAVYKQFYGSEFQTTIPEGYLVISFVDSQSPSTAYRGDTLQRTGAGLQLVSDVIVANANNYQSVVQEMAYGGPFPSAGAR